MIILLFVIKNNDRCSGRSRIVYLPNYSGNENVGCMITESAAMPKVTEYLRSKEWQVKANVKLRGRAPDLAAIKDGRINVIAVKASGDIQRRVKQTFVIEFVLDVCGKKFHQKFCKHSTRHE
jgi:hypothetical protein